jgi:hydrogenase maturation protease
MTCQTTIICIGNIARGDDGVAHDVARRLLLASLPDTRVIAAVGLDVAMTHDIADADFVIFVDAENRNEPPVVVREVAAGPAMAPTGHAIDAPSLLMLAEQLYDASPVARIVGVAAPEMGHGESLSDTAEAASVEAASTIASLINTFR